MIWLVRHGQASWGAADYDVLSELGRTQARITGETLARLGVRPDLMAAGRLNRQQDTAAALAAQLDAAPPLTTIPAFDEFDGLSVIRPYLAAGHGASLAWALDPDGVDPNGGSDQDSAGSGQAGGARGDAYARLLIEAVRRWMSGEADEDYRESFPAFLTRVRDGVDRVETLLRGAVGTPDPQAVVVSSGGVIAALAASLLLPDADPVALGPVWLRLNWALANASLTRIRLTGSGRWLVTYNEHAHLAGNLQTRR